MVAESKNAKILKYLILFALSAMLSVTTVILGAIPLLPARRATGRWIFSVVQIAIALGFVAAGIPFYGLIILAQSLVVGVYVEVEEHHGTVFTSGAVAILAAVGASVSAGAIWLQTTKLHLGEVLRQQLEPLVGQLSSASAGTHVLTTDALIQQLPSGAVIALVLSLALALISERRISFSFRLHDYKVGQRAALLAFRVPDLVVWLVVLAIAGAFLKHGNAEVELVSINVLNALVVLYFFQGLAIVSQAFRVFKITGIWRSIWYVLIVLQLFLMVSLLGFADYWLDFRERLNRKSDSKPAESKPWHLK